MTPGPPAYRDSMKTLLNIIWLVLAGFWMALGYVAAGILCCVLIVTIPFGIASFRIAGYALWPFGRTVVALCVTIIGIPLGIASFKMVPISLLPLGKVIV